MTSIVKVFTSRIHIYKCLLHQTDSLQRHDAGQGQDLGRGLLCIGHGPYDAFAG